MNIEEVDKLGQSIALLEDRIKYLEVKLQDQQDVIDILVKYCPGFDQLF